MQDYLQRYNLLKALIVFILAQLIGTGFALGLLKIFPNLASLPGVGLEVLRGVPALLIIVFFWLEMVAKKVNYSQSLGQVFARITPFDIVAVAVFNLAVGILSILVIIYSVQLLSDNSLADVLGSQPSSLIGLLVAGIMATIIAPISEEIVFRGWLFNALKRKMQVWPALILSSIAFSAIHPSLSSITTFLFGVCVAIAYYKTRNLWVPIIIHSLNNFLISAQSRVEHFLIHWGLVDEAANLNQLAFVLGIPGLVLTILLGFYLVKRRRFFKLTVPLYP
jgi:membrane protease YdiL (CAAX protease family)